MNDAIKLSKLFICKSVITDSDVVTFFYIRNGHIRYP